MEKIQYESLEKRLCVPVVSNVRFSYVFRRGVKAREIVFRSRETFTRQTVFPQFVFLSKCPREEYNTDGFTGRFRTVFYLDS